MQRTVTIKDETTGSPTVHAWTLDFLDERISAREFIRRRVHEEVKEHNARPAERYRGLIEPTDAERELNGYRLKKPRRLDWEEQYARAVEGFERNAFIMLVDDRQVESLDEEMDLRTGTEVTFLKLVPLVGG